MLKGYVFNQQIFPSQIFALFINTFLNGQNGVSNNYLNGMAVSYSGSNVTISSGAVCIQGRFLGEDSTVTLNAGTSDLYCKLVIEINLDNTNTAGELTQANYKIVTSASSYPELTQTNIVKNNSGIYQYELARFKTSVNGITNFQDMRTFLDFESIYSDIRTQYHSLLEELEQELAGIEDGSAYVVNSISEQSITDSNNRVSLEFKKQGKIVICKYTVNKQGKAGALINTGVLNSQFIPNEVIKDSATVYDGGFELNSLIGAAYLTIYTNGRIDINYALDKISTEWPLTGTVTYMVD